MNGGYANGKAALLQTLNSSPAVKNASLSSALPSGLTSPGPPLDPWSLNSARSDTPSLLSAAGPPNTQPAQNNGSLYPNGSSNGSTTGPASGRLLLSNNATANGQSSPSQQQNANEGQQNSQQQPQQHTESGQHPPSSPLQASNITENEKVYLLIAELCSPVTREGALLELSKKREQWDDLALVLWHSFGQWLLGA